VNMDLNHARLPIPPQRRGKAILVEEAATAKRVPKSPLFVVRGP
jgi:hypothetical protein